MKKQGLTRTLRGGFTLIELLVVIAVIGILASVVLVSLNSARSKGTDAKIKQQLNSIRTAAEMYYDSKESYENVCDDPQVSKLLKIGDEKDEKADCLADEEAWRASMALKAVKGSYWCVDSDGASKIITSEPSGTACP